MYTIYALVDNDGVVKYVGQTTQVDVRKRDHTISIGKGGRLPNEPRKQISLHLWTAKDS